MIDSDETAVDDDLDPAQTEIEIPLAIVIGRILIVSGIGISAALAIFFLIGGIWLPGAISFLATVVFLALMFGIEKLAE